jgi:hypothetical protein
MESIDWQESTINVHSLCDWMHVRNFQDGFFIGGEEKIDNIANSSSEFYAPKLAAAVRAWKEVTADHEMRNGKAKALEIWLRKHANEYGLTGVEGNPNQQGIEEICKVANWRPGGGAPRTPEATATKTSVSNPPEGSRPIGGRVRANPPTLWVCKQRPVIDDELPF